MRAGLVLGLVALGIVAASSSAEARGRRGGGFFFISRSHAAPAAAPTAQAPEPPRIRTAAAETGGPEPMTTGATPPAARPAAAPAPAPVPAQRPWCTGRVFGSGAGFCAIN